ncbi:hypothetical protein HU200_021619 [Digitaria exilis]|uniref:Uncharacterized protein n=1 Tax=Digitaria exilis TaxID=1010633 RepID=A0A835EZC7_9POAL|nr:hypothetical protein HU200_021619 [Digitaria exilis]
MTTTRVVLRRFNKVGPLATATELCDAAAELLATAIFVFAAEGTTLAGRCGSRGIDGWHTVVFEAAMVFGIVYAYYATAMDDPRTRAEGSP